ncbi:relaxase/mobilization nuclease domain-containing protein [Actinacidiphila sp. bgisy144]|uniref:relaxase/mobilization nuclease domain-containing protein n=1 Tax=Actinacidiphila sp. bgisy144 TaxID=3413791 RepID=UPI003EB968E1
MIAKITRGKTVRRLLGYLYGPGRANEHTDPHLVASWDGFAPDPGRDTDPQAAMRQLTQALDLRLNQARHNDDRNIPDRPVWQCSIRAAPEDPILTDDQWAAIARRIVHATGISPDGDPDGCRWVAVRHAPDHIHIAATTLRGDLRTARHWNDYLRADKELEAVERDYHLRTVIRGDRTAAKRPTRAETEKAHRTGRVRTPREQLRTIARTVVAVSTSPEEYLPLLAGSGVHVEVLRYPSGDIRGYKVALDGDTNAAGEPIWFSGSTLAPDLSYPQIRNRLTTTEPTTVDPSIRRTDPWHQATAAIERIPHHLDGTDDKASQAHIAAFAEALDALPLTAPVNLRPQLRQAALAFERASRSRIAADHQHARALRGAIRAITRQPTTADDTGLAMFLDAAILAVIAIQRWHSARHQDQQVTSAYRALAHLQTVYDHAAAAPLTALTHRTPAQPTVERWNHLIQQAVPTHAEQILADPAWPALTSTLTDAETAGHDPTRLLQLAADQRALDDARSPAHVLIWRLHRLAQRPAPSPRARAATARSTLAARRTPSVPTEQPAAHPPNRDPASVSDLKHGRRR